MLPASGSTVQIKILKHWLHRCDKWHNCTQPSAIKPHDIRMPTRLLDLGAGDTVTLRLDCREVREGKRFTALTHCWGDTKIHEPLSLRKDNYKQWQRPMDINSLPKTYRDAIHITRSIGIRCLWIDSLCIIKDDELDREAEIQNMEDVFTFA